MVDAYIEAIHEEWDRRRTSVLRDKDHIRDWQPITWGDLYDDTSELPAGSPLTAHGYHVAQRAKLTESLRRVYLECCILGPLMPAFEPSYLAEWGVPKKKERLQRVVTHIHGLTIGRNSTQPNMRHAVALWCSDLEYLRERYSSKADINWPEIRRARFAG